MKLVKYRFKLNYKKEEDWINEMSKQGWQLERFDFGRYVFTKGEAYKYVYRNHFIADMKKQEKIEYKNFLSESGIDIVHESAGWLYLRKQTENDEQFNLYTDNKSHISYYKRLLAYFYPLLIINIFAAFVNLIIFNDGDNLSKLNISVGLLNIVVAIILLFPIYYIHKEKKLLENEDQLFER